MTETPLLHVDMDAFYASVALRERPDLVDQPVVVGGSGRGVVLAANYVARRYGIRSALPMTRVRRLCPHVVVLEPDYSTFTSVSASVMETFRDVTPVVEAMSLDEAFLDVRGSTRRLGTPAEIAEHLRATIHDEQGITCSVGVAASVSVAKVASRRAKPDGVVVVPPAEVTSFLHPLDVGELYGVGEKTQALLHRFGLLTVGDVAHTPLQTLQRAVGDHLGRQLHHLAWGTDRSDLTPTAGPHEPERSMGADETFARDTDDRDVIVRELLRLSARVGRTDARGRGGRPHRHPQGPLRRLHHHHPLAHDARGHRRHRRGAPRGDPSLRRARAPACAPATGRRTGGGTGAAGDGAPPARARRARARVGRGRPRGGPRDAAVRGRGGPSGEPGRDGPRSVPRAGGIFRGRLP